MANLVRFIVLTTRANTPVWINPAYIISVGSAGYDGEEDGGTCISCAEDSYLVTESVDIVLEKIKAIKFQGEKCGPR